VPWVVATGRPETLSRKAAGYLRVFDYKEAAGFDSDVAILAKVVCNLRNYYRQSAEQTVELVQSVFNPKSWQVWSPEGIKLAWDLVEGFTPSLGLSDEKAVAKQRAALIEDAVIDLIAWTKSGGRVSGDDLLAVFAAWNPDLPVTPREFGVAVKAVTGQSTVPIHGVRYWVGFHLPITDELQEPVRKAA
jgi:hypothetical protein